MKHHKDTLTRDLFDGTQHQPIEEPPPAATPLVKAKPTRARHTTKRQLAPGELDTIIRDTLTYEPDTGLIRYRINTPKHQAGDIAGNLTGAGYKTGHGYLQTKIAGKFLRNPRIAWFLMTGAWPSPGTQIDHINHQRTDDRWSNLRLVSPIQNAANSRRTRRHIRTDQERQKLLIEFLDQQQQQRLTQ